MPYTVILKKTEEKRIVAGHAWVYANEVQRIEGKDKHGSLATVLSADGKFIGKGYINHLSKILVRIFIRDENQIDDENLYIERITQAKASRTALGYDNCYRAIFAEADNLPALIVDKYDDYLVCQFLSLGIDKQKDTIVDSLVKVFAPKGIYERSDVAVRQKEGLEERTGVLYGEVPDKIVADENGLKMSVDVKNGQKTGFFLDQKYNRREIARLSRGKTLLDCFTHTGSFALNAAIGGAKVTAVDISETALDMARHNAAQNGLSDKIEFIRADVFDYLRQLHEKREKPHDFILLDPPAFTKSRKTVGNAANGYREINSLAMRILPRGGYLATCSCSHFMRDDLFRKMLTECARDVGVRLRQIEARAQAPDHPVLWGVPETEYLKFYIFQIE